MTTNRESLKIKAQVQLRHIFADYRTLKRTRRSYHTSQTQREVTARLAATVRLWKNGDKIDIAILCEDLNINFIRNINAFVAKHNIDAVTQCTCCNLWVDAGSVTSCNDGEDSVCEPCLGDHYTYSDCMGEYIHSDDAHAIYYSCRAYRNGSSDDYCTEYWGDRAGDLMENNGTYFDANTYYELFPDEDEDEDEDEEERESQNDGLQSYHGSSRHFLERNSTPHIPALGLEIEVYCEQRSSVVQHLKEAICRRENWYLETDSSISEYYGFEIVTQPYGPTEWPKHLRTCVNVLRDNKVLAYTADTKDDMYGIHVNVSDANTTRSQRTRMQLFLLYAGNKLFLNAIAQRERLYGNATQAGSQNNFKTFFATKNHRGFGKYSPVHIHDGLLEFRMFQSTVCYESIMKNLEFVWALIKWTTSGMSSGYSYQYADFLKWLGTYPKAEATYPHLLAFLRKPMFYLNGDEVAYINPWKRLLPKQTTKSLDTLCGDYDSHLENYHR